MREHRGVWLAASAVAVGDVDFGTDTSLWPFACVRGDVAPIRVGRRVSIQDFAMLHCRAGIPLDIGDEVIVGHHACVHCRRVGAGVLVGIHAAVLDDAEIGAGSIVAAGAVVPPRMIVPPGVVVAGVPARIVREVRPADQEYHRDIVERYVALARQHAAGQFPNWSG